MKLRTIWSKGKTRSVHVMTRVYVRYHVTGAIICGVAMMSMSNQPAMSHHDNHGHNCGEHAHGDDHDHAHDHTSNSGPSDNLFAHIDRDNVVALNSVNGGSEVIKPWDERMDEQVVSTRFAHDIQKSLRGLIRRVHSTSSQTRTINCRYRGLLFFKRR